MESQPHQNLRPAYAVEDSQMALLRSVFSWMSLGIFITGTISFFIINSPGLNILAQKVFLPLFLVELGLVWWLSARVMKMSTSKARTIFLLYSALNGVTLAPLALIYTGESITSTLMISSTVFAGMAIFGYVTNRDLSQMASFLYMGFFGIIIALLVNIFMQSSMVATMISCAGVIVFTGLTAWDTQRIKQMGAHILDEEGDEFKRMSILSALTLYLNFINLFIFLLQLLGDRD